MGQTKGPARTIPADASTARPAGSSGATSVAEVVSPMSRQEVGHQGAAGAGAEKVVAHPSLEERQ
ncbi:MAG TPA: hypothetical protein VGS60_15920, partial [Actinomycetes bacterium]|nr:hypothetical protein [Actinomycetes bacterium]